MGITLLNKELILEIFEEMNKACKENSISVTMYLYGGASMCLIVDTRPLTRDIDCIINSTNDKIFKSIISDIGARYSLSIDWLNSEIERPLKSLKKQDLIQLLSLDNLSIQNPSIKQMLAMKILSARPEPASDFYDANILCKKLDITTKKELMDTILDFIPLKLIGERQRMFITYLGEDLGYDWE